MIQRKTPLRKRPTKRRTRTPRCSKRGCKRAAEVMIAPLDRRSDGVLTATLENFEAAKGLCRSHSKQEADRLWATNVKAAGACEMAGVDKVRCGGPLQAAHGLSRRYLGTRYLPLNGFALCAGHHRYYGVHPLEWDALLNLRWGPTVYEELRRLALNFTGPVDYAEVLSSLASAPKVTTP